MDGNVLPRLVSQRTSQARKCHDSLPFCIVLEWIGSPVDTTATCLKKRRLLLWLLPSVAVVEGLLEAVMSLKCYRWVGRSHTLDSQGIGAEAALIASNGMADFSRVKGC